MYRRINAFKKDYQPINNLVKHDMLADSHSILNMWKNCFFQLLGVQIGIHTAEPLIPGPSHLDAETAIAGSD
jgi:hypothetical protein